MAPVKSYTDIEQSKKLAEFLPLESSDMVYSLMNGYKTPFVRVEDVSELEEQDIPCWSLAALLEVYPMIVGKDIGMYCCWQNHHNLCSRHYDNPIDACYEMILKLHEQKLL